MESFSTCLRTGPDGNLTPRSAQIAASPNAPYQAAPVQAISVSAPSMANQEASNSPWPQSVGASPSLCRTQWHTKFPGYSIVGAQDDGIVSPDPPELLLRGGAGG